MNVYERAQNRKKKVLNTDSGSQSQPNGTVLPDNAVLPQIQQAGLPQAPKESPVQATINQPHLATGTDTRDWRRAASYEDAVKLNPALSRSQYVSGVSQFRNDNGMQSMSNMELFQALGGKDPYISYEDQKKQEKRLQRAERINAVGNVLANLVNYMRTKNGHPVMNLKSFPENQARIDRLKAYQDALAKSNYSSYMDIIQRQKAEDNAKDAAKREFQQRLYLEQMKRNSPLARAQAVAAEERANTERARQKNILADTEYKGLRATNQEVTNRFLPAKEQAELELTRAKAENEKKNNKDKKKGSINYGTVRITGNQGISKSYDMNKAGDIAEMYNLMTEMYGDSSISTGNDVKSITDMRNYIYQHLNKYREIKNNADYTTNGGKKQAPKKDTQNSMPGVKTNSNTMPGVKL